MFSTSARIRNPKWLFASLVALCISGAVSIAHAADAKSDDLPLKKVVLFSSGVGFFEHSGEIDGDRTIEFKFNTASINDLLKSLVALDLGGGQISAITYGSREPLAKTLRSFSIDLTRNPSIAELLRQVRGERIRVTPQLQSPVEGRIVSIESRQTPAGKAAVIETDMLNLATDDGLQSIDLSMAAQIQFLDPQLDKEFRDALVLLAGAHSTDKKSVSLTFSGKGRRPVRVGYIQDSPIWKTSYRLVLDDKQEPFLQGWAIVENTTEHDWHDISMTLVSGRPVSFIMDLYEPRYVDRPVVAPELFGSLVPRVYQQDMSDREAIQGTAGRTAGRGALLPTMNSRSQEPYVTSVVPVVGPANGNQRGAGMGGMMGGMGGGFGGNAAGANKNTVNDPQQLRAAAQPSLDLNRGVKSAAQADEVGELFRYTIDRPVSIARQESAMLPIVNESVNGEKVSIYNPDVEAKHPLAGLKFRNTTKLHLMQGPITVFDGGEYAGDAQIEDIAPGASRLISYALDLNLEVAPRDSAEPERLTSLKIVHGILHWVRKSTRTKHYIVKNSGDREKRVLIEQPIDANWALVNPKAPAEKTRDLYRFAVDAPADKTVELTVEEEHTNRDHVAIASINTVDMVAYTSSGATSPAIKAALADLKKRRDALALVEVQMQEVNSDISNIDEEQTRIRQNMGQLDHASDLYKRYVKMFDTQEDQIAKARAQLKALSAEADRQERAMAEFTRQMDVE